MKPDKITLGIIFIIAAVGLLLLFSNVPLFQLWMLQAQADADAAAAQKAQAQAALAPSLAASRAVDRMSFTRMVWDLLTPPALVAGAILFTSLGVVIGVGLGRLQRPPDRNPPPVPEPIIAGE